MALSDTVRRKMELILQVDSKTLDKDLKQIEGKFKSFSSGITSGLKYALLGLVGSGGAITLFSKSMLDSANKTEVLKVQLEQIYKSAPIAAAKLKEFQRLAIDLPNVSTEQVVRADVAFDRYGISLQKWLPLLVDWREATHILGTDLDSLILSLAKLNQGGLGAQTAFRTMLASGVTKKELSQYGVEFDEVNMKLLSSTKQTFEGLEKLIVDKFGGAAQRSSKIFADAMDDAMELWDQIKAKLGTPLMNRLNEELRKLINYVLQLEDEGKLDEWAKKVGDWFVVAYEKVKKFAERAYELAAWFVEKVQWLDENVGLDNVFIVAVWGIATIKLLEFGMALRDLVAFVQGNAILSGLIKFTSGFAGGAGSELLSYFGVTALGATVVPTAGAATLYAANKLNAAGPLSSMGQQRGYSNGMYDSSYIDPTQWGRQNRVYSQQQILEGLYGKSPAAAAVSAASNEVGTKGYSEGEQKAIEAMKFAWSGYYDYRKEQIEKEVGEAGAFGKQLRDIRLDQLDLERQDYIEKNDALGQDWAAWKAEQLAKEIENNNELMQFAADFDNSIIDEKAKRAEKEIDIENQKAQKIMSVVNAFYGSYAKNSQLFASGQISLAQAFKNNMLALVAERAKKELEAEADIYLLKAAAAVFVNPLMAAKYMAAATVLGAAGAVIDAVVDRNTSKGDQGAGGVGVGDYDATGSGNAIKQQGTTIRGQSLNITIAPVISISGETILIGNMTIEELRSSIGEVAVKATKDAIETGEIVVNY